MRFFHRGLVAILFAVLSGQSAYCDPLGSNIFVPVLPNPDPSASPNFLPEAATAGAAFPGDKLGSIPSLGARDCSSTSPCALPPPALTALSEGQPPISAQRQRSKENGAG
jgi:hypothetical protein